MTFRWHRGFSSADAGAVPVCARRERDLKDYFVNGIGSGDVLAGDALCYRFAGEVEIIWAKASAGTGRLNRKP